MNNILSEKDYQKYILEKLSGIGYEVLPAKNHYDRLFAISRPELLRFLEDTQPEKMEALRKIYKESTEDTIVKIINNEETKIGGSRLNVLKHGVSVSQSIHLDLLYTKPATTFNKKLNVLYEKNIFSVAEEVWASSKERIDLVIFLNGLAIISFELKANTEGQNYEYAIAQYRFERNPKTRLFLYKAGCLVNFAMDLEECHMTTKLEGKNTFFLPFNQGRGKGIDAGAGNPLPTSDDDDYSVHYMWDTILQKDSVLEIITKFMFIDKKDKKKDFVIFPRYHQIDVIHKLLADVYVNKTSQNYLLQHSTGSGKTNEIAWLAYRLSSLHDADNNIIYDNIIICTDRIVVDRQLQNAVSAMEHQSGFIQVMDDKCDSGTLARALEGNTKVIVTTIQKFRYVLDKIKKLSDKKFAVIIDEAHSSTAGKNMAAVTNVLGNDDIVYNNYEDEVINNIKKNGKQANVSIFAFTATPRPMTLQLFGRRNENGMYEAFHIYSMKQAIEEGFILDVLENYITYDTYFQLNKTIEENPIYKTKEAKKQIAKFLKLHPTNIGQRIEIIIEHFKSTVKDELGGTAKAMVVTSSRKEAVMYRQAFEKYIKDHSYTDIHALIAFSGSVLLGGEEYTESGMNGFSEEKLPQEFDKDGNDGYQVLLVADKYQTGFDQKKLCAMYILKKLSGISTVQTLSRLNRVCPPYEKHIFVLDFVNDYQSIVDDFSKFYTTTILANSVNPDSIRELEAKIDVYSIASNEDIERFNKLLCKVKVDSDKNNSNSKRAMSFLLQRAKNNIERNNDREEKRKIVITIKGFIKFYEFLIKVACFESIKDTKLYEKYNFYNYLCLYLRMHSSGPGFDLSKQIQATNFMQTKTGEHVKEKKTKFDAIVMLHDVGGAEFLPEEDKKRLSSIIEEINNKTGKNYNNSVLSLIQIRDVLLSQKDLRTTAKNNSEEEFKSVYYQSIDEILKKWFKQNEELFTLLLDKEEYSKKIFKVFLPDVYKFLKEDDK